MEFLTKVKGSRGACHQIIASNRGCMSSNNSQQYSLADAQRGVAESEPRVDFSIGRKIIEIPQENEGGWAHRPPQKIKFALAREKSSSFMGSNQYFAKLGKHVPPRCTYFQIFKIEKSTYSVILSYN